MPVRVKIGSWHQRSAFQKVALWSLSQMLGCFCFGFDLLRWLLSGKNTITGESGLIGLWCDVTYMWWSSVDRSNKWIGKTITIIPHVPGEY